MLAQKAQNLKNQDYLDLRALASQQAANSLTNKPKIIPVKEFEMSQVPGSAVHSKESGNFRIKLAF